MRMRTGLLVSISAATLLAACAQRHAADPVVADAPGESVETAITETKSDVKLAPPITTVKPGASVTFSHDTVAAIAVNETGTVTLTVNEGYPDGTLTLQASGEEGLDVFGAQTSARFDMADVTTHTWRINFASAADGAYHIHIMATADMSDGYSESRAYAVPVKIGDWQSAQSKAQVATTIDTLESGETAVVMQAEETID